MSSALVIVTAVKNWPLESVSVGMQKSQMSFRKHISISPKQNMANIGDRVLRKKIFVSVKFS